MKKYKYFELDEFIRSDTAKKKGIENSPTFEIVEHLEELVEKILEPLREAYGMPIRITSGYRCPALNSAVKGSSTSAHLQGYAADCVVGGSFNRFREFVVAWLEKTGAKFDQVLLEKDAKTGARWIHIALRNNYGLQRCQIKVMEVNKE